jgi:hypothetical protein
LDFIVRSRSFSSNSSSNNSSSRRSSSRCNRRYGMKQVAHQPACMRLVCGTLVSP